MFVFTEKYVRSQGLQKFIEYKYIIVNIIFSVCFLDSNDLVRSVFFF